VFVAKKEQEKRMKGKKGGKKNELTFFFLFLSNYQE
jgi:hypothetical protein